MNDAAGIVLDAVRKSYGGPPVLDDACASIAPGEFIAVIGRSGSGKSTLLKLIGGLSQADSGSVRHGGTELSRMTEQELTLFRRRALGFVYQSFNLVPTLTLRENVTLPLALNRVTDAAATARVRDLLAQLGLRGLEDRFPDQLSGGEQQRAAIARALAHEPDLVITDEPTGNLDRDTADEVLNLLIDSCRRHGATLIMATHSRSAAARADRIIRIVDGKLVVAE